MILTVDIGNTNITVGAWDHEQLAFVSRLQTNVLRTQDEFEIDLLSIIHLYEYNASQFDGAIISSVVPPLSAPVQGAVRSAIRSKRVFTVSPGLKTGLNIRIDDPGTLGSDIVCASVAAIDRYTLPCVVITMRTTTTISAIDAGGGFLGGAVMAGIPISLEALARRTAQLPHVSVEAPNAVIGTNTIDCMKSGAVFGTACMIDGLCSRMKERLGEDATLVATGVHAETVVAHCHEPIVLDEHLVLHGLHRIYHKNIS